MAPPGNEAETEKTNISLKHRRGLDEGRPESSDLQESAEGVVVPKGRDEGLNGTRKGVKERMSRRQLSGYKADTTSEAARKGRCVHFGN